MTAGSGGMRGNIAEFRMRDPGDDVERAPGDGKRHLTAGRRRQVLEARGSRPGAGSAESATVRSMSMRQFSVVVEWDSEDEVWVTHVPALDHLSTYGHTREAALESTREAIVGYLEAAAKDGIPLPRSGPEPSIVELEVALP